MESIRDVLQSLTTKYDLHQAEERFQAMRDNRLIREFCSEHPQVEESVLRASQNLMYQFIKEQINCAKCPGLDRCPNLVQGHFTRLVPGQVGERVYLYDEKVACSKWTTAVAQRQVNQRVKSYYVDHVALHESLRFDDLIDANPGRAEAVGQVVEYLRQAKSGELPKFGLYLTGAFGRGKTFLLCYLLRELAELGYTGVILHMPQFVEEVKSMIQDPAALRDWTETLKQADVLMFDDIGAENLTPWVRDHILGAILTARMNHKPTFYSSNYSLDDLGKLLSFTAKEGEDLHKGQRLMERVRNYVKVVHVKGSNMRELQSKSMIQGANES